MLDLIAASFRERPAFLRSISLFLMREIIAGISLSLPPHWITGSSSLFQAVLSCALRSHVIVLDAALLAANGACGSRNREEEPVIAPAWRIASSAKNHPLKLVAGRRGRRNRFDINSAVIVTRSLPSAFPPSFFQSLVAAPPTVNSR
ncbi:MAG TPA: hypothetical protein VMV10_24980 [Pirellulales bacterium]|nr:hypothetical protein [Pirellulales bacterium]